MSQDETVIFSAGSVAEYLVCPLCKGYFREAVTLNTCFHTFCRACLYRSYVAAQRKDGVPRCPTCTVIYAAENVQVDAQLQKVVDFLFPEFAAADAAFAQSAADATLRFDPDSARRGIDAASTEELPRTTAFERIRKGALPAGGPAKLAKVAAEAQHVEFFLRPKAGSSLPALKQSFVCAPGNATCFALAKLVALELAAGKPGESVDLTQPCRNGTLLAGNIVLSVGGTVLKKENSLTHAVQEAHTEGAPVIEYSLE